MGTTNTLDLNNRIDKLEKAVSGGDSAQANKSDIATEFSATTNYTAGCFVYHGGKLYQFNADHSAGAWDPTDVVEANVTDQVVSNAAAIAGLTATDVAYDNTASGLTATDVQGAVDELRQADNIMMSDGVTSVEEAVDDATPRTATGTTIGDLVSAVNHLSETQKSSAVIKVNESIFLRRGYENQFFFQKTGIEGNAVVVIEYNLRVDSSVFYMIIVNVTTPGRTSTPTTITSWTLYYSGTPIS